MLLAKYAAVYAGTALAFREQTWQYLRVRREAGGMREKTQGPEQDGPDASHNSGKRDSGNQEMNE